MEKKIFLLALDNRPCSYKYFNYLSKAYDLKSSAIFNSKDLFSKGEGIFIISVDNFFFDGIVNSRKVEYFLNLEERYRLLLEFLQNKKHSDFYLYVSVPRLLLNFGNIDYIIEINRKLMNKLKNSDDILKDYENYGNFDSKEEEYILTVRSEKLKLIKKIMESIKDLKNVKEFLVVIDDSQIKGLNFIEISYLERLAKSIFEHTKFYKLVGLDEIHLLIFAKIVSEGKKRIVKFSSNNDITYKKSIYEGVSLKTLIKQYEKYLDISLFRDDFSKYYWNLFDGKFQKESFIQVKDFEDFQDFLEYFSKLSYSVDRVFSDFTDLSFANGASLGVLKYFLENYEKLVTLNSFWAWNTLANTLGSSLAQYIISVNLIPKNNMFIKKLVVENFLESLYQTIIRPFAKRNSWNVKEIKQAFLFLFKKFDFSNFCIDRISLPWNRYFEIDIIIKEVKGV